MVSFFTLSAREYKIPSEPFAKESFYKRLASSPESKRSDKFHANDKIDFIHAWKLKLKEYNADTFARLALPVRPIQPSLNNHSEQQKEQESVRTTKGKS